MSPQDKLMLACCLGAVVALGLTVFRVLGAWSDHHLSRHNLIVESKRRRIEYFNAVAERQGGGAESGIIIDDADSAEPALADELAQAA